MINVKKHMSFSTALSERLALPGEALGGAKLSVVDARQALIENHKGLLTCTEELIAVRVGQGSLRLYGSGLYIEAMNDTEMLICGKLSRAEWDG